MYDENVSPKVAGGGKKYQMNCNKMKEDLQTSGFIH